MKRLFVAVILVDVVLAGAVAGGESCDVRTTNPGAAVIAYAYLLRHHAPEFPRLLDSAGTIFADLKLLQEALEKRQADIPRGFVFAGEELLFQGDVGARPAAVSVPGPKGIFETDTVFVSTPIQSLAGRSVVVFSLEAVI